jgi:hypothetical protein
MDKFAGMRRSSQRGRLDGFNVTSVDLPSGFVSHVWEGPKRRTHGDALACRGAKYLLNYGPKPTGLAGLEDTY